MHTAEGKDKSDANKEKLDKTDKNADKCSDLHCPAHGKVSLRGQEFVGKVVSAKMQKTVTVQWGRMALVRKYERYITKRSKVHAHNPICINAKEGDLVRIKESRPLSKTKAFVVTEILKRFD